MRAALIALAAAALAACVEPALRARTGASPRPRGARRGFVERRGRCLARDGARVRLLGANAFFAQEDAAREALGVPGFAGRTTALFDAARGAGLNALRVAGFNDGPRDAVAIQTAPGVLAPAGMAGLDRVVEEAGRRGLSLIVVLSNYWDDYGGAAQYLRWRGYPADERARLFREPALQEDVARYAAALVSHTNARTGVRYADDPTIAAWEVMNEPRGTGLDDAGEGVARFVAGVARAVREAAPRQLVLAGDEGFDADARGYDAAYWRGAFAHEPVGPTRHESFRALVREAAIDGATVHWYPDSWGVARGLEREAGVRWMREHARIADEAGKPIVFEEFGLARRARGSDGGADGEARSTEERRETYEAWLAEMDAAPNVAGFLPWGFAVTAAQAARDEFAWGVTGTRGEALTELLRAWSARVGRETDLAGCE